MHLSRIGYYADFYIAATVIATLAGLAVTTSTLLQTIELIVFFLIGAATWTLFEYAVHRWIYHKVPIFKDLHAAHHDAPGAHIGAPPVIGIIMILGMSFAPIALTGFHGACGLACGMLLGYIGYMGVHHMAHHFNPSANSWLNIAWLVELRRHHALHHHRTVAANYGITTSFWDHVFGTAWEAPARKETTAS